MKQPKVKKSVKREYLFTSHVRVTIALDLGSRDRAARAIFKAFTGKEDWPLDVHFDQDSALVEAHRNICRSHAVVLPVDVFSNGDVEVKMDGRILNK